MMKLRILFSVLALVLLSSAVSADYVEVVITSANGSGSWTIPDGVTEMIALAGCFTNAEHSCGRETFGLALRRMSAI